MTKIPTEAIRLAISGGWTGSLQAKTHTSEYIIGYVEMNLERVALDREFWKSLGCKLEWGTEPAASTKDGTPVYEWMMFAHEFYDLILSGQDPTEWWQRILPAKDN